MTIALLAYDEYERIEGETTEISSSYLPEDMIESLYMKAISKSVIGCIRMETTHFNLPRIQHHSVMIGSHGDYQSFETSIRNIERELKFESQSASTLGFKTHWAGFKIFDRPE